MMMAAVGDFEERTRETGNIRGVLTRIELQLAYTSEKVLNLEILLIHVIRKAGDLETLARETDEISIGLVEKTIELDILSGILDSEANELDYFISSLMREILGVRERIPRPRGEYLEMPLEEIEEKLHGAEETVKQSQDQVLEIKRQIEKFDSIVHFAEQETCNGGSAEHLQNRYFSSSGANKWKMQTVEMQRNNLQLLEKSLARELEIEKNLTDARRKEEEIKLKLHYAEQETYFMEGTVETLLGRLFEAENSAMVQTGISKELVGKLQAVRFDLNGSLSEDSEMKNKLVQHENDLKVALKVAEEKCETANSEAISLREKVNSLEEQLRSCNILSQESKASHEIVVEQQNILNSELLDLENVILDLRENLFKTESRAENAEARCTLLTETNMELNEEMGYLKSNESEKAISLEIKLKESNAQLEQAYTNVEALEERTRLLTSSLSDMGNVVEKLKTKVSEAENRAGSAESRCALLTKTNLELNKELSFLRGKLQSLERDLHRTDNEKIATANDIGIKTKEISNLVMRLALKREQLLMQLSALRKENKILAKKCWKTNDPSQTESNGSDMGFACTEPSNTAATECSSTNVKMESPVVTYESETVATSSQDNADTVVVESSKLVPRRLKDLKHLAMVILVLLVSILGVFVFQMDACPL